MDPCSPLRGFLHILLFMCSAVLLGLTAYRIHYTKTLTNGDILTPRSHYYDPIIVELLVSSILALIFSLWLMTAIFGRFGRNPMGKYATEHVMLWPVWIMLLVGAAIATHKWNNLKQCRRIFRVCRVLESIKAFSWICWGLITLILLASLVHMLTNKRGMTGPIHGGEDVRDYSAQPVNTTRDTMGQREQGLATTGVAENATVQHNLRSDHTVPAVA